MTEMQDHCTFLLQNSVKNASHREIYEFVVTDFHALKKKSLYIFQHELHWNLFLMNISLM